MSIAPPPVEPLQSAAASRSLMTGRKRFARLSPAEASAGVAAVGTRPNCVCSLTDDEAKRVEPLPALGPQPIDRIRLAVESLPRTTVEECDESYLHATVRSQRVGFVDDLECLLHDGAVHVRSASRIGHGDHGVNRARVEALRRLLAGFPAEAVSASRTPWHARRLWPGLLRLVTMRHGLRKKNLHPAPAGAPPAFEEPVPLRHRLARSADGRDNDLSDRTAGMTGCPFGRNVPPPAAAAETAESLGTPNPRAVADALLGRKEFLPATSLNLLAAAWIQFQVHGWFNHGRHPTRHVEIPLPKDEHGRPADWPEPSIRFRDLTSVEDRIATGGTPPTSRNTESHWWDGSQIYGSCDMKQSRLRTGSDGKLRVEDDGRLPQDDRLSPAEGVDAPEGGGIDLTGFNDNYWVGLALFHTLFTKEHNAVCDALIAEEPGPPEGGAWTDDRLFDVARLTTAAVIAKIHTVEWTPAPQPHPAISEARPANWDGVPASRLGGGGGSGRRGWPGDVMWP
ncbi:MAG: peroxidase family protein, partial [Planctomycetota bacterium]